MKQHCVQCIPGAHESMPSGGSCMSSQVYTLTVCLSVYISVHEGLIGLMGHSGPSHSTFIHVYTFHRPSSTLRLLFWYHICLCAYQGGNAVKQTFMVYIHNTKVFPVYCIDTKPAVAIENDSLCSLPGTSDSYRYTKHSLIGSNMQEETKRG